MRRHLHILEFAVASLRRNLGKNLVVVAVYSLLVAVLASLLVFLESARLESRRLLAGSPDLIVQRIRGGRHEPTPIERAQDAPARQARRHAEHLRPQRAVGADLDRLGRRRVAFGADDLARDAGGIRAALDQHVGQLPDADLAAGTGEADRRYALCG